LDPSPSPFLLTKLQNLQHFAPIILLVVGASVQPLSGLHPPSRLDGCCSRGAWLAQLGERWDLIVILSKNTSSYLLWFITIKNYSHFLYVIFRDKQICYSVYVFQRCWEGRGDRFLIYFINCLHFVCILENEISVHRNLAWSWQQSPIGGCSSWFKKWWSIHNLIIFSFVCVEIDSENITHLWKNGSWEKKMVAECRTRLSVAVSSFFFATFYIKYLFFQLIHLCFLLFHSQKRGVLCCFIPNIQMGGWIECQLMEAVLSLQFPLFFFSILLIFIFLFLVDV